MTHFLIDTFQHQIWQTEFSQAEQTKAMHTIEEGGIVLFPALPFHLLSNEQRFLTADCADNRNKNISFNVVTGTVRGCRCPQDQYALTQLLQRFATSATQLIQQLLPSYTSYLQIGRTSYRPVEIAGRETSYRKDDTRLHVDAFPATPNQGKRILRVFCNINPQGVDRVWRVGEPFAAVAQQFLPKVSKRFPGSGHVFKFCRITKSFRTAYDHIMLQIHDRMKADLHYQQLAEQRTLSFAPGYTWIVQTDHVSHAAMSGQFLLEQTFYLPVHAMRNPSLSPLFVLEKLTGKSLV